MKELIWLNSSKKNLMKFPKEVIQELGYALYLEQKGRHYNKTKLFKGYGSGIYEVATEFNKNAYRAILMSLNDVVYVVHCFQKKSKIGIKTPKEEIEVIKQRLKILKEIIGKR